MNPKRLIGFIFKCCFMHGEMTGSGLFHYKAAQPYVIVQVYGISELFFFLQLKLECMETGEEYEFDAVGASVIKNAEQDGWTEIPLHSEKPQDQLQGTSNIIQCRDLDRGERDKQRQKERQTETDGQTETERETYRQRQKERQTDRQTDRQREKERQTDRDRERQTDRWGGRETERGREGEKDR